MENSKQLSFKDRVKKLYPSLSDKQVDELFEIKKSVKQMSTEDVMKSLQKFKGEVEEVKKALQDVSDIHKQSKEDQDKDTTELAKKVEKSTVKSKQSTKDTKVESIQITEKLINEMKSRYDLTESETVYLLKNPEFASSLIQEIKKIKL